MKSGSRPLNDMQDFQVIKRFAEAADWNEGSGVLTVKDISVEARAKYFERVLIFVTVDAQRSLRVVVSFCNVAS